MMRKPMLFAMSALTALVLLAVVQSPVAAQGPRPRPQTWVDGELFAGVVTPANFDPSSGNFDELYNCGAFGGFKDEVPLISESKPGDQDYNGGRWHLNLPVDASACTDVDTVEDLNLALFISTDVYFECPLLPRRG